jgi:hypothetical protein
VALRAARLVILDHQFESPTPPRTKGLKAERVIHTNPSAPPEKPYKSLIYKVFLFIGRLKNTSKSREKLGSDRFHHELPGQCCSEAPVPDHAMGEVQCKRNRGWIPAFAGMTALFHPRIHAYSGSPAPDGDAVQLKTC